MKWRDEWKIFMVIMELLWLVHKSLLVTCFDKQISIDGIHFHRYFLAMFSICVECNIHIFF